MLDTGETTFKRYVRDAGVEYLEPLNPSFGTIRMSDSIVLIGRVIDAKLPKSMF
jgi:SOS-response transcriptional repressor LexA